MRQAKSYISNPSASAKKENSISRAKDDLIMDSEEALVILMRHQKKFTSF
jgi:hypothetical protein